MPRKGDPSYDKYKGQQAEISRERSERGREIGPLPECENPARRNACLDSLRAYCQTYR